jgi:DNA-binding PadR family transcriptional regulator
MPSFSSFQSAAVLRALADRPGSTCSEIATYLNEHVGSRPVPKNGSHVIIGQIAAWRPWDATDIGAAMQSLRRAGSAVSNKEGRGRAGTYSITDQGLHDLEEHREVLHSIYRPDPAADDEWQFAVNIAAIVLKIDELQRFNPSEEDRIPVDPLYNRALLARGEAAGFVPPTGVLERLLPETAAAYREMQEWKQGLDETIGLGWLERVGDDEYRLTDEGAAEVERMMAQKGAGTPAVPDGEDETPAAAEDTGTNPAVEGETLDTDPTAESKAESQPA